MLGVARSRQYIIKKLIGSAIKQALSSHRNILYKVSWLLSGPTVKVTFTIPVQENLARQVHPYNFSKLLDQALNWLSYQLGYDEEGKIIDIKEMEDEHKLYYSFEINTEYPAPRLDRKEECYKILSYQGVYSNYRIMYENEIKTLESWKRNKSPNQIYEDKIPLFDNLIDRGAEAEILELVFDVIFRDTTVFYAKIRSKGEDYAKGS